jgi:hypothetical protein
MRILSYTGAVFTLLCVQTEPIQAAEQQYVCVAVYGAIGWPIPPVTADTVEGCVSALQSIIGYPRSCWESQSHVEYFTTEVSPNGYSSYYYWFVWNPLPIPPDHCRASPGNLAPTKTRVVVGGYDCTINLSRDAGGSSRMLAEIEPGKVVTGLRAAVTCGGVATAAQVKITARAMPNSGGHKHDDGLRPTGSATPGGGTSPLQFSYAAPAISGDYTLTAECTDRNCGTAEGTVWVGIQGLVHIPSSGFWNFTGSTGIHPVGWYLNGQALGKLMDLGRLYKQVYFPFARPLLLNDASLERGGVFDIDWIKYDDAGAITSRRTTWWTPPHYEHQRGVVVDIVANGTAAAIPQENFEDFEILLRKEKMTWLREKVGQSGGHFHVRLLGVAQ